MKPLGLVAYGEGFAGDASHTQINSAPQMVTAASIEVHRMKAGWQITTLDQIALNLDSRRRPITKAVRVGGEFPYYGASGIVDYVADYIFDEDTLLISEDGANLLSRSTPIAFPASGKYWVNNHAHILKFDNPTTQRFVELYLASIPLDSYITGAAQPKLNQKALNSIPIPFPPLPEQQRIVALLDEAFDGIATASVNAETNLQNAWELVENQLAAAVQMRGEGWVEMTIGDVCILKSGTTVPVLIERSSGDIPYVKVAEMNMSENDDGITTSIRFLNKSDVKPGWIIPAGAVIFPKRGGSILTNKKRLALVDICADLNIMSVIPSEKLTSEFLYLYFLTIDMRKLGTGSSIPQINNYDIAPLLISFPESKAIQIEIAETLRSTEIQFQTLAGIYSKKIAALDELKKSLLHHAFSGEL